MIRFKSPSASSLRKESLKKSLINTPKETLHLDLNMLRHVSTWSLLTYKLWLRAKAKAKAHARSLFGLLGCFFSSSLFFFPKQKYVSIYMSKTLLIFLANISPKGECYYSIIIYRIRINKRDLVFQESNQINLDREFPWRNLKGKNCPPFWRSLAPNNSKLGIIIELQKAKECIIV